MTPVKLPDFDLEHFQLARSSHRSMDEGACLLELSAHLAGEPFSDQPACVSPVIAAFGRSWNDELDDDTRQMLKPYAFKIIDTATGERDDETRAWMATDWLARECAPAFLRSAGLTKHAEALEALAPLVNATTARKAQPTLNAARAAAGDAAGDAAWAAARDPARAAAGDAARAAAGAAAWAAAWDAARAAARAAAGSAAGLYQAAAWAALTPTVKELQASALLLIDRMCEVGRESRAAQNAREDVQATEGKRASDAG